MNHLPEPNIEAAFVSVPMRYNVVISSIGGNTATKFPESMGIVQNIVQMGMERREWNGAGTGSCNCKRSSFKSLIADNRHGIKVMNVWFS